MEAITGKIGTLVLSMWTKIVNELATTESWRAAFVKDPESTNMTEDGKPAVEPAGFIVIF